MKSNIPITKTKSNTQRTHNQTHHGVTTNQRAKDKPKPSDRQVENRIDYDKYFNCRNAMICDLMVSLRVCMF